jgi:hypothetical protein
MKTLTHYLYAIVICVPLLATGCNIGQRTAIAAPTGGTGTQTPAPAAAIPQPTLKPSINPETAVARVANPIYHPGSTDTLELSGTFEGQKTIEVSGKITLIVAKESSHGKPVNAMNSAIELHFGDGKRHQIQDATVYGPQSDGSLRLLYKDSGSVQRWVESTTCPAEPADFIEGHTDGCEVHYDDGSSEKSTSTVTKEGDYLKVTWISESTDKDGVHNSTEAYWFDVTTGHLVRYSGTITLADGSQMTLAGK